VLTLEEWEMVLAPKVQNKHTYAKLMEGLNISDPIELEEKILDLRYRTSWLRQEVNLLKKMHQDQLGVSQHDKDRRREKGKKKGEQEKLVNEIKSLEEQFLEKQQGTKHLEEEREKLELEKQIVQRDQVEQKLRDLEDLELKRTDEYEMRRAEIKQNVKISKDKLALYDQEIIQKDGRLDDYKRKVERFKLKLQQQQEIEQQRDQALEKIMGRAVNEMDLAGMAAIDLKTLNQLNNGQSEQMNNYIQRFAAITIQKVFRGNQARW